MTDMVFGNPWHGRLTPSGLVLADGSTKTAMAGNNAAGAAVSISYKYPGDTATGNTYYVKTPGLPVPVTPPLLSAAGGEFKNDAVLFGSGKRYSPFSTKSLLGLNEWLHYGADGKWRKMRLEVISQGVNYHTVRITRRGEFGQIGKPEYTEITPIAEFTLTHTAPMAYVFATFPALDASRDGRAIVVTRCDAATSSSEIRSQDKWQDGWSETIIAAWRIDIAADAGSATVEQVWQIAAAESVVTPLPTSHYVATGPVFVVRTGLGNPNYNWTWYEPFEGQGYVSYGEDFYTTRLVGVAWAPDGSLQLIEWRYRHDFDPIYFQRTGVVLRGGAVSPTEPAPPASAFPATSAIASNDYPSTSVRVENYEYQIEIWSNETLLHTMAETDAWPVWSVRMTNNVFNLRNSAASIGRFGPGAAHVSSMALTPLYASYNPRVNQVVSSTTPIGFV